MKKKCKIRKKGIFCLIAILFLLSFQPLYIFAAGKNTEYITAFKGIEMTILDRQNRDINNTVIKFNYNASRERAIVTADQELEYFADENYYLFPVGTNITVNIPPVGDFPGLQFECVQGSKDEDDPLSFRSSQCKISGNVSLYDVYTEPSDNINEDLFSWNEYRGIGFEATSEGIRSVKIKIYSIKEEKGYFLTLWDPDSVPASGSIYQEESSAGNYFAGEDSGTSIISEILDGFDASDSFDGDGAAVAVSVAGALAAAGAAGAAGSAAGGSDSGNTKSGKKKEKKKKTSYKMYVYKEFGDAIRKGDPPVKVFARISQIIDGEEYDCPEQTARIQPSGENLTVQNAGIEGAYLCALVSPQIGSSAEEGIVSFTLTGPGGTFHKKVKLRLVDEASLFFVEDGENADTWQRGNDECEIDAILGDGFTYTRQFMIQDTLIPPKLTDITAVNTGGLEVKFEMSGYQGVYTMHVRNTTKSDPAHDIFAKSEILQFQILVKIQGEKEPLRGDVAMNLYHEGLTLSSMSECSAKGMKYINVVSYEKTELGGLDDKWQSSQIAFHLAIKENDRVLIDPKDAEIRFQKLKGAGGMGTSASAEQSVASKYVYKLDRNFYANEKISYTFQPNTTLCEPEDGSFFMVLLPAECEYSGRHYQLDVPLRLQGEFVDPYAGWEEEYELLKKCVEKFSLPEDRTKWFIRIEQLVKDPVCSTAQLHLTRQSIVRNYMDYWLIESIAYQNDVKLYDSIINDLEWLKFIGDCAFSFLLSAYAGPFADALISPAKDFFAESVGELAACWKQGTEVNLENFYIVKHLEAAGDNLMSNNVSVANWKQAAATLGAYFVYASIKSYLVTLRDKQESDLYGALVKGFSDMSVQALKAAFGELLGRWIKNNRKVQKWIVRNFTKTLNKNIGKFSKFDLSDQRLQTGNLWNQLNDSLKLEGTLRELAGFKGEEKVLKILKRDILMKYLTELLGAGAGWVKEKTDAAYDSVEDFDISINEYAHIVVTFSMVLFEEEDRYEISINLTKLAMSMSSPFFALLFDELFGRIPTYTYQIQAPAVPQLPPRDNKE